MSNRLFTLCLTVYMVFAAGCSMFRLAADQKIAEVSMQSLEPTIDAKIARALDRKLAPAVDEALRKCLGDLTYDSLPWILALLGGGGGVAAFAKSRKNGTGHTTKKVG